MRISVRLSFSVLLRHARATPLEIWNGLDWRALVKLRPPHIGKLRGWNLFSKKKMIFPDFWIFWPFLTIFWFYWFLWFFGIFMGCFLILSVFFRFFQIFDFWPFLTIKKKYIFFSLFFLLFFLKIFWIFFRPFWFFLIYQGYY